MPIQFVANPNINPTKINVNYHKNSESNDATTKYEYVPRKIPTKLKVGVFLTTFAGIATAMAITLKGKGYKLNLLDAFKTHPKEWAIFKVIYDKEKNEVEKLVGRLAVGSLAGGLVGGALFDKKENMKAKYREAVIQLVGNIATPLLIVSQGTRQFEKYEPKILNSMPFLKGNFTKLPSLLVSGASLLAGILLGNTIGNFINKKTFHVKGDRKIKLADMSPHLDDVCLVASLTAAESKFGPYVTRLVPAALMVAGVSAGLAPETEKVKSESSNVSP